MPSAAGAFSAEDVLTRCLTTPADPASVRKGLLENGWAPLPKDRFDYAKDALTIAYIATGTEPGYGSFSPTDWQAAWKKQRAFVERAFGSSSGKRPELLYHTESASVLEFSTSTGLALGIWCLLIVPEKSVTAQSYHPRRDLPEKGRAFRATWEGMDIKTTRTNAISLTVDVNPSEVSRGLGVDTDVGAVLRTSITYPAWAVTP